MEPEPVSIITAILSFQELLWVNAFWQLSLGFGGLMLLLLCSALVSGSEIAYFSLSPNDLERLDQEEQLPSSRRVVWLLSQPEKLLATILISNNFINIAIVLLAEIVVGQVLTETHTMAWAQWIQQSLGWFTSYPEANISTAIYWLIAVAGITTLLVLFGEVTPKVYATINSIRLSRFMSGPLSFLMQIFSGPSQLLVNWSHGLERRLANRQTAVGMTSKQEIDEAIELTVSQEEDSEQDLDILKRIVKFPEVNVTQIMRSRVDVVGLDDTTKFHDVLAVIKESGYSRYPVYEKDADNVVGILYAKDLLMHRKERNEFPWQELIRTNVLFVPESKKINDLLSDFQLERMHMAVVVDEYGGTSGIVTLEDIMEEIIGEIQDEFDDEPDVVFQKIDDFNYVFEGKTLLNDVARIIGVDSERFEQIKGDSESLGGLILERLGRMPKKDREILLEHFRFKVLETSQRRIERILITLMNPSEE
ncbi:MAG: gliding motility-associated protein GldE [Bacteroidota bacterium]